MPFGGKGPVGNVDFIRAFPLKTVEEKFARFGACGLFLNEGFFKV